MMRRAIGAGALLMISMVGPANLPARDLGVQGHVWSIVEIDLRELLIASAARVDWDRIDEHMHESAEQYLSRLPRRAMQNVTRSTTRWIDPSFVLDDDIRAPIQNARGEWEWSILYTKGMRFNPLSVQRPDSALLFFDARAKAQVALASEVAQRYPARVMLIEATGENPQPLARSLKTPVISASDAMVQRFGIRTTPCLLYAGEGERALLLGLTEFAPPYSLGEVERAVPALAAGKGMTP